MYYLIIGATREEGKISIKNFDCAESVFDYVFQNYRKDLNENSKPLFVKSLSELLEIEYDVVKLLLLKGDIVNPKPVRIIDMWEV